LLSAEIRYSLNHEANSFIVPTEIYWKRLCTGCTRTHCDVFGVFCGCTARPHSHLYKSVIPISIIIWPCLLLFWSLFYMIAMLHVVWLIIIITGRCHLFILLMLCW